MPSDAARKMIEKLKNPEKDESEKKDWQDPLASWKISDTKHRINICQVYDQIYGLKWILHL